MRDLTADELDAVLALRGVTFPVASFDKRFHRQLSEQISADNKTTTAQISDRGAAQLWRLVYRYRRQIGHPRKATLLRIAEVMAAPDLRNPSVREAAEAQARINKMRGAEPATPPSAELPEPWASEFMRSIATITVDALKRNIAKHNNMLEPDASLPPIKGSGRKLDLD